MPKVSFAADIKPLLRDIDISHMKSFGVELDDYTYMSNPTNANSVLATVSPHNGEPPSMPPGGPTLLDSSPTSAVRPVAGGGVPAVSLIPDSKGAWLYDRFCRA